MGPPFPQYTIAQMTAAFKNGASVYRKGGNLVNCPAKFRPQNGNKTLNNSWLLGFEAAGIAQLSVQRSRGCGGGLTLGKGGSDGVY